MKLLNHSQKLELLDLLTKELDYSESIPLNQWSTVGARRTRIDFLWELRITVRELKIQTEYKVTAIFPLKNALELKDEFGIIHYKTLNIPIQTFQVGDLYYE